MEKEKTTSDGKCFILCSPVHRKAIKIPENFVLGHPSHGWVTFEVPHLFSNCCNMCKEFDCYINTMDYSDNSCICSLKNHFYIT